MLESDLTGLRRTDTLDSAGMPRREAAMHDLTSTARLFRFGIFELDPRSGELRRHGLKIRLPHQSFEILRILLDRPGEVVTREELRQRLWTSDTFVDFNVGLNSAVRKLREALDDSAENPRFVETLPRRGYRFIASVTPALSDPIPEPQPELEREPEREPTAAGPRRRAGSSRHGFPAGWWSRRRSRRWRSPTRVDGGSGYTRERPQATSVRWPYCRSKTSQATPRRTTSWMG